MKFPKGLGFSLVELLVSISIISILISSALFILRPQDYLKRSRDSRRQSDLKVIQTALEQYYANSGIYPVASPLTTPSWTVGPTTYLRSVPKDPSGGGNYCYATLPSGYETCAFFEGGVPAGFTPPASCGASFNGCVNNPF